MTDPRNTPPGDNGRPPVRRLKIIHDKVLPGSATPAPVNTGPREKTFADIQNEKWRGKYPTFKSTGDPALDGMEINRLEKLDRDITAAHAAIVDSKINRIRESMFVNEMLPFLFDEIPPHVERDPSSIMTPAKWIAAAGGPTAEFDVVSDTTNEVLFRVPAFFARDLYDNEAGAKRGRLARTFMAVKQLSHMSPNRAKSLMSAEFTDRGLSDNRTDMITKTQERWNEIFKRYGRPLLGFDAEKNTPVQVDAPPPNTKTSESGSTKSTNPWAKGGKDDGEFDYHFNGFDD